MSINTVESPFPIFTDVDGNPLESGYIYIGEANQNPEVVPVTAYWDSTLTTPAAQPIRTIGGYPSRAGTAARLYVEGDYSITVRDKNGTLVYTAPVATDILVSINSLTTMSELIGYTSAPDNTTVDILGYSSVNDGGGGLFNWDSAIDKSTANSGTIIDPSVSLANQGTGVGLGCWIRQYSGAVNARWFGTDTSAIQLAITHHKHIYFDANGDFTIVGEVKVPSDRLLEFRNATIDMTLDGENARGFYFEECSNSSIIGSATFIGTATTLGTASGFRNNIISFGNEYYKTTDPTITNNCSINGDFTLISDGAANAKLVSVAGYVENLLIKGIKGTGSANYPISCHWTATRTDGGVHPAIPDKTWHPHNIVVENCRMVTDSTTYPLGLLRSYTFSACGHVEVRDCYSDSDTLGYNLFIGDFGYTYAANIIEEQAFQFELANVEHYGTGEALSIDVISSGLSGSPVWTGTDHSTRVLIDNLRTDATNHPDGLTIGITGIKDLIIENLDLWSTSNTHTREWAKLDLSTNINIQGKATHHKYLRAVSIDNLIIEMELRGVELTPDATSYRITLDTMSNVLIKNSIIKDSRAGVFNTNAANSNLTIETTKFEQIGFSAVECNNLNGLTLINNYFIDVGTTTTTENIYFIFLEQAKNIDIHGNRFGTNNCRYLIYTTVDTENATIYGNRFEDINLLATSPAAIYLNVSATNVYIDPNSNIVSNGVILTHT